MLYGAWDRLARKGGKAPGPNGRRYEDLDDNEVWDLISAISALMKEGKYVPGPVRRTKIPKDRSDPSRGTRTLTLPNIEDRVVQRVIVDILQPLLDPLFGDTILGFRPGRDRVHALMSAQRMAEDGNRYVWIAEDIKNAFDNVPRGALMEVVAKYVPSPELVALIKRFVYIDNRKRGIPQGSPLSPLLLNLYLYHHLERQWAKKGLTDVPIIRVADDLLLLCLTQEEAESAWGKLDSLLRKAGLSLKHGVGKSIVDLAQGESANWLGYRVWLGKHGLEAKIAKRAWGRLRQYLELAHEKPDSPLRAIDVINGWIDQLGPCYSRVNLSRECARMQKLAAEYGFDEIPSRSALRFRWLQAHLRWKRLTAGPEAIDEADSAAKTVQDEFDEDSWEANPPAVGLCVDAAWNPKKRAMEYRGVWLHDRTVAFEVGPLKSGSNNLGEFLAIVHAFRFLKIKGIDCPVYSDSQTAMTWFRKRRLRSPVASRGDLTPEMYVRLTRALLWVSRNKPSKPVVTWDTVQWDEIPADYGRK
jgi:retron-type reverse transcriptase/ribonuclease HI